MIHPDQVKYGDLIYYHWNNKKIYGKFSNFNPSGSMVYAYWQGQNTLGFRGYRTWMRAFDVHLEKQKPFSDEEYEKIFI